MSQELRLLDQALGEALASLHPADWNPSDGGGIDDAAWSRCAELGWDHAGLPEDLGGVGDSVEPLVVLARGVGRLRLPIPLVETALARWALATAGREQPPEGQILTVGASLRSVPWARSAAMLLLAGDDGTLRAIELNAAHIEQGTNLAGESRDHVTVEDVGDSLAPAGELLRSRLALLRAAQIAGALERVVALTREHTASRKQFGRPLARFQLVGAHLSGMAARQALLEAMLADAVRAHLAGTPEPATTALALAAADAATDVARSAHQCHGAIGVTREYELHHYTRRLWAWREEAGSEREWSRRLGEAAIAAPAGALFAATQPQD